MREGGGGGGGVVGRGAAWWVGTTPPANQVVYSSDAWPGRIYKLSLDGKGLGVLGQSGKQLKQFGWIHAMACPSENVLYVAELLNSRGGKMSRQTSSVTSPPGEGGLQTPPTAGGGVVR